MTVKKKDFGKDFFTKGKDFFTAFFFYKDTDTVKDSGKDFFTVFFFYKVFFCNPPASPFSGGKKDSGRLFKGYSLPWESFFVKEGIRRIPKRLYPYLFKRYGKGLFS